MPLKKILTREEEARLVFLAKQGNPDAWSELLTAFEPLLESIVRRNTPGFSNRETEQDLAGEAKLGFSQAVREFDPGRNRRLATVVHLVVRRLVVDYIRKATRPVVTEGKLGRDEVLLRTLEALYPEAEQTDETTNRRLALLDECLLELPPLRRHLVDRVVCEGQRLDDVASDLRMDVSTIRGELQAALKSLRRLVE